MELNIIYEDTFTNGGKVEVLINEISWVDDQFARRECFMADTDLDYQYIKDGPIYRSIPMHPLVSEIMENINLKYGYELDVCFLNYYQDKGKALGYHADDSHPIDHTQPIAVVSFGAVREIWWKEKGLRGDIPDNQKQKLADGSLFIMPPGMQSTHLHKIPKCDYECGPRVSLTFRKWKDKF